MIRTSHVGSFPLPHSMENLGRVLEDLSRIGIAVPPYPQLRSFVDIYLEPLVKKGVLEKRGEMYYVKSLDALEQLKKLEPSIPEAEYAARLVRERGYRFAGLRAPVTGAFTLASRINVDPSKPPTVDNSLVPLKEYVGLLAEYVRRHLEYMAWLGYTVLFIDEPFLGVIVGRRRILMGYTEDDILDYISKVYEGLPGEHGIHVCGRISPRLFEILVRGEHLHILNFEFHDNPENIGSINPKLLIDSGKKLAPGVASSKKPQVETADEILQLLKKIGELVEWRVDLVSADCGFGGLAVESGDPEEAYRIGLRKLENIVKAVSMLEAELEKKG
jgi:5-methyltetrahydropteroyltriglutamate--homocysteine methyltransferase